MKKRNILYCSRHSVLEYDECLLLKEINMNVFCIADVGSGRRPKISQVTDGKSSIIPQNLVDEAHVKTSGDLNPELLEYFDTVIFMCATSFGWIVPQWEKLKSKLVICRMIGQHMPQFRDLTHVCLNEGLQVVTYSDREAELNGLSNSDKFVHMIPFYKDPSEFSEWTGRRKLALTCNAWVDRPNNVCHPDFYLNASYNLPRLLSGPDNAFFWLKDPRLREVGGDFTCLLPYSLLKEFYRDSRCYLYLGTEPACYTLNFMEAFMTGIPVLAYETGIMSQIIENGRNGFCAKDPDEAHIYLDTLLSDIDFAREIGMRGRETAIEMFAKEKIKQKWIEFFEEME